ncbi:MAG: hypothetical protein WA323_11640 [Candidatus Nitrosopolaris sp.]
MTALANIIPSAGPFHTPDQDLPVLKRHPGSSLLDCYIEFALMSTNDARVHRHK